MACTTARRVRGAQQCLHTWVRTSQPQTGRAPLACSACSAVQHPVAAPPQKPPRLWRLVKPELVALQTLVTRWAIAPSALPPSLQTLAHLQSTRSWCARPSLASSAAARLVPLKRCTAHVMLALALVLLNAGELVHDFAELTRHTNHVSFSCCAQGKLTPRAGGGQRQTDANADTALLDPVHQQPSDADTAPFPQAQARVRPPTPPRHSSAPSKQAASIRPVSGPSRPISGAASGASGTVAAREAANGHAMLRSKSSAASAATAGRQDKRGMDDSAADRLAQSSRSNSSARTSTTAGRPQTRGAFEASAAKWSQRGARSPGVEASEQVFTDLAGVPLQSAYFRSTPAGASQGCCTIM